MYTRSYTDNEIKIPEKYCGTALEEMEIVRCENGSSSECSAQHPAHTSDKSCEKKEFSIFNDLMSRFGLFDSDKGFQGLLSSIGYEEILIIGLAILLFFCSNPDRECALILLALVFIK
jgi:hypothetical protein